MFPLAFYFSDSVVAVFPDLAHYFPDKTNQVGPAGAAPEVVVNLGPDGKPEDPGRWYVAKTEKGFVAWARSHDGTYRMATGCHAEVPASLQVTHVSGNALGRGLHLNYQYGLLELGAGAYAGPDLVGAVAQFSELYLQTSNREVLAQFNMNPAESGQVARQLQAECAAPAAQQ